VATFALPYCAVHARNIAQLAKSFQHTYLTGVPAAASRKNPMI
jgi:hypothetical protein